MKEEKTGDRFHAEVSLWGSYTARKCAAVTLDQIRRKIAWGSKGPADDPYGHHPPQELIGRRPDPRMLLEYACFSGVFHNKCHPQRLLLHSGLVTADCENLAEQGFTPPQAKQLTADTVAGLALAYITPSGNGLRIAVAMEPVPAGPEQHRQAFLQLAPALRETGIRHWSDNGADLSYRCPLSFDPQALTPETVAPFPWRPDEGGQPRPGDPLTWEPAPLRQGDLRAVTPADGTVYRVEADPAAPGKWNAHATRAALDGSTTTVARNVDLNTALEACRRMAREPAPRSVPDRAYAVRN